MPQKIIVDSSVIVKWLNRTDEENLDQADKIMEDVQNERVSLLTCDLAKYEVGNALLLSKKLTIPESKISLPSLYSLPITFLPLSLNLSKSCYKIAKTHEVTFYDASFMALAKQEVATLVTDNPKHQAKVRGVKVVALKDYK